MASIYVRASDEMEDDRSAGDDYLMDAQYFDQMHGSMECITGSARVGRRRPLHLHLHRVPVCAAARRPSVRATSSKGCKLQPAEKQRGGRSISLYPCGLVADVQCNCRCKDPEQRKGEN